MAGQGHVKFSFHADLLDGSDMHVLQTHVLQVKSWLATTTPLATLLASCVSPLTTCWPRLFCLCITRCCGQLFAAVVMIWQKLHLPEPLAAPSASISAAREEVLKGIVNDQILTKPPPPPTGVEQRGDKWGLKVNLAQLSPQR